MGEHRARAEQPGVAEHLDRRAPPWRAATWASSAAVSQAWTWTRAPVAAASSPTARSCSSVEQVGAVRAHPAPIGGVAVEVARGPRHAGRRTGGRRRRGTRRRPGPSAAGSRSSSATALAASGKKYMSSAVVMPARRHSATASAVPAATVDGGQRPLPPPAAAGRGSRRGRGRRPGPRNIVIARWVWALTRPGTTMPPPASITRARRRAPGAPGGPTVRMIAAGDRHVGAGQHGAGGVHRDDGGVRDEQVGRAGGGGGCVIHGQRTRRSRIDRSSGPTRSAAASPAAMTSSPSSGTSLMPAARFVASDRPRMLHARRGGRRWPR